MEVFTFHIHSRLERSIFDSWNQHLQTNKCSPSTRTSASVPKIMLPPTTRIGTAGSCSWPDPDAEVPQPSAQKNLHTNKRGSVHAWFYCLTSHAISSNSDFKLQTHCNRRTVARLCSPSMAHLRPSQKRSKTPIAESCKSSLPPPYCRKDLCKFDKIKTLFPLSHFTSHI